MLSFNNDQIICEALWMGIIVTIRGRQYKTIANIIHLKTDLGWIAIEDGELACVAKRLFSQASDEEVLKIKQETEKEKQRRKEE